MDRAHVPRPRDMEKKRGGRPTDPNYSQSSHGKSYNQQPRNNTTYRHPQQAADCANQQAQLSPGELASLIHNSTDIPVLPAAPTKPVTASSSGEYNSINMDILSIPATTVSE